MEPITLEIDGVKITLRSVQRNKKYECDCKKSAFRCSLRQQLSTNPSDETLTATEAVFNIRNISSESWSVLTTNWELVDTDGYAYKARALCDSLRPPQTLEPSLSTRGAEGSHVTQGTQVDFILVFPNLEADKEIAHILYSDHETLQAFEISELKPEALDLTQARESTRAEIPSREPNLRRFKHNISRLEGKINSRLNKTLTRDTGIILENDIKQSIIDLRRDLKFEDERTRGAVEEILVSIITPYESQLEKVKTLEEERKKLDQEVETLSQLPPREFEEWFADLLKNLGYEKVTLTPSSNDEGIDVLAEHKGLKVAVQCKRWKKSVGSPVVQAFLGAMKHAEAQHGMLITTGFFTPSAIKMAAYHPIDLVDRADLTDLIQEALQK
jgi:restriction endonuclease Mrr